MQNEDVKFLDIPWNAEVITLEKFMNDVIDNKFTDENVNCFHATKSAITNIEVKPSNIIKNKFDGSFRNIVIFKK